LVLIEGCAALQDSQYRYASQARCEWACLRSTRNPLKVVWQSHFIRGWKAGYLDVLTGGYGQAPAVPPYEYWESKYHNDRGRAAVKAWYQGFRSGAHFAASENAGQFHYVKPFLPPEDVLALAGPEVAEPELPPEPDEQSDPEQIMRGPRDRLPAVPSEDTLPLETDAEQRVTPLPQIEALGPTTTKRAGWR
jgi:hypothetical protein